MADQATPTTPRERGPSTPSKSPTRESVFVDYLGEPDLEGHRRPGHKLAPIVAGSEGGKIPRIVIRPGLTVQDPAKWAAHCPASKKDVKPGVIRGLVDDDHLVVLEELPTDALALLELAARTRCPDALQVLIDHEARRKIDEHGKNPRPRKATLDALKAFKASADRRAKSPISTSDQRRLEAHKAKTGRRVLH